MRVMFNVKWLMVNGKSIAARVYAIVLFVAFVAVFNWFTALIAALFFVLCFLFAKALEEIKWRTLFFEEDKET